MSMKLHLIVIDPEIYTFTPMPVIYWQTEVNGVVPSGKYFDYT